MSRVWLQFPNEASAYHPHAGAHGGDAVFVPQVSAEVQTLGWQKQSQVWTELNKMNLSWDLRHLSFSLKKLSNRSGKIKKVIE